MKDGGRVEEMTMRQWYKGQVLQGAIEYWASADATANELAEEASAIADAAIREDEEHELKGRNDAKTDTKAEGEVDVTVSASGTGVGAELPEAGERDDVEAC